jgi:uncharacterized protein YdhG (YjbR/CyaY superfamily)
VLPEAGETISYGMPTVTVDGHYLIYYSGWKNHLGLYPVPALDEATEAEVAPYRSATSTLKFPYAKPIPYDLIEKLILLAAAERTES